MAGQRGTRTLIVGLGNPELGDDGVGHVIVRALRERLCHRDDVDLAEDSHGGLHLMERLQGYHRAVVIDASLSGVEPGTVSTFGLVDVATRHSACTHDVGIGLALRFGRRAGADLPEDGAISFVAIEAKAGHTFCNSLSASVRRAVPQAVDTVMRVLTR